MADSGKRPSSAELYARAQKVLPGGVSRNTVLRAPHPVYVDHASGCRVWDIEGVERIDFANNVASLIHGHAHPAVNTAVMQQLEKGSAFTVATEVEIEFAEHLISRNKGFESLRFVNSGTEAVMGMLKASRAFTGRAKIAKVEGAYHGLYDYAEISQTASPATWGDWNRPTGVPVAHGTPAGVLNDVVILPCNDIGLSLSLLNEHKDDLACVLLDPMSHRVGLRPVDNDYAMALRDWARAHGALMVLDEVITFRCEYGGAQEWIPDLEPDLTAMGKMIGGGFPVGAIAGRREVMDVMNPLAEKVLFPHSGTFSANPVTMTAGLTAMKLFDREAVAHVNRLAERARQGIREVIGRTGAKACVTGGGSMFRVHMKAEVPHNYRQAFLSPEEAAKLKAMLDHLFDDGFLMINTCSATISTAMGDDEIDALVDSMERGFKLL